MEDSAGPATPGVRPEWMFCAARECQLLAGTIACGGVRPIDIYATLFNAIPATANALELYVLESLVGRALLEVEHAPSRLRIADTENSLAARAARILRERYAEPWRIKRLARQLATNRLRLTSEFRADLGLGVHQYLVSCRVEAAERLVRAGEKIETTAHAVGFRSKKTLYDAFRRVRGTLPSRRP